MVCYWVFGRRHRSWETEFCYTVEYRQCLLRWVRSEQLSSPFGLHHPLCPLGVLCGSGPGVDIVTLTLGISSHFVLVEWRGKHDLTNNTVVIINHILYCCMFCFLPFVWWTVEIYRKYRNRKWPLVRPLDSWPIHGTSVVISCTTALLLIAYLGFLWNTHTKEVKPLKGSTKVQNKMQKCCNCFACGWESVVMLQVLASLSPQVVRGPGFCGILVKKCHNLA